jgi:TolB-like protein
MNANVTLFLLGSEDPLLKQIHFASADGRWSRVAHVGNEFKWSRKNKAVRALCLCALRYKHWQLLGRKAIEFQFQGRRGSPASTLYTSLEKDTCTPWFEEVFGMPPNGKHTYASQMFTARQHYEANQLLLGVRVAAGSYPPYSFRVLLDGNPVEDHATLAKLIETIESHGEWKRRNEIEGAMQCQTVYQRFVAILPLESGSKNGELAATITDCLLTLLSQTPSIQVLGKAAVSALKLKDDVFSAGRQLGLTHLLEGRVFRVAGSYQVNLRLVEMSHGSCIWGQSFEMQKSFRTRRPMLMEACSRILNAFIHPIGCKAAVPERTFAQARVEGFHERLAEYRTRSNGFGFVSPLRSNSLAALSQRAREVAQCDEPTAFSS